MLLVWGPHFENHRHRLRQGRTEFFVIVHILSIGVADKAVAGGGGGVKSKKPVLKSTSSQPMNYF